MQLHAERSAVKPASVDIGFTFQTQQADDQILVNDGETAVIGGLTVTTVEKLRSGIPLLSAGITMPRGSAALALCSRKA